MVSVVAPFMNILIEGGIIGASKDWLKCWGMYVLEKSLDYNPVNSWVAEVGVARACP